jgi:uncharacterized protein (DUF952 family)
MADATRVYKILTRGAWAAAMRAGRFEGAGVDLADGYIHLSTAAQAPETARLHFAGQMGLVLLRIDAAALGEALKWEPSRGGQLFPHLYGGLDCALVEAATPIALGPEGTPELGVLLP